MLPLCTFFSLVQDKEHVLSFSAILTGSISIKRLLDTACLHAKKDIPNRETKQIPFKFTESSKAILQLQVNDTVPTYLPTYHSSREFGLYCFI